MSLTITHTCVVITQNKREMFSLPYTLPCCLGDKHCSDSYLHGLDLSDLDIHINKVRHHCDSWLPHNERYVSEVPPCFACVCSLFLRVTESVSTVWLHSSFLTISLLTDMQAFSLYSYYEYGYCEHSCGQIFLVQFLGEIIDIYLKFKKTDKLFCKLIVSFPSPAVTSETSVAPLLTRDWHCQASVVLYSGC